MYKEKKMKRLFATLLVGVLLFNLTACGNASPSTADTSKSEASSTTEAPSISTDQETEESDNKQVASEEIYPDGLWTIDRIEGIADQKQSEDAIKTLQSYCTCILGNSVYTFDNVGWGRYSTLTLEEEGSKDSPVDIGYCNKYSTKTDSATEISYMSNDYWVMPVNQSDGSVVSFIYKNTKVVPSGQAFALNDEQSADAFTEETRTDSIENIEYLVPASWGVNDTAVPNAIIYSPTQDTTQYYFMCRPNEVKESITGYHGDAVSQPDDDESSDRRNVLSAFVESMNNTTGMELSDVELTTINGYLTATSTGSLLSNGYSFDIKVYAMAIDKDCIFSAFFAVPEGTEDPYTQDEMALLESVHSTTAKRHSLIQTTDQDPEKDVYTDLDYVDEISGSRGLPIIYIKNTPDLQIGSKIAEDIVLRAYYNRANSSEPVQVRMDILHNGEVKSSDTMTMYLGSVLKCDPIRVESDDLGYWVLRLVEDETNTVLSELVLETSNEPVKPVNTSIPQVGMTAEEVINTSWGEPDKKNITEAYYGTHEQWVYRGKGYVYFEDGVVTAVQRSE